MLRQPGSPARQVERKPFLDGTLLVRDLDPGIYEHRGAAPEPVTPIDQRQIRLFPQPRRPFVPVPVPPDLFRDTPIRDIPDADLGPVQQALSAARERLAPIGGKAAGRGDPRGRLEHARRRRVRPRRRGAAS